MRIHTKTVLKGHCHRLADDKHDGFYVEFNNGPELCQPTIFKNDDICKSLIGYNGRRSLTSSIGITMKQFRALLAEGSQR